MRKLIVVVLLVVVAFFIGCATSGGERGGGRYVIELEEIQTANATDAYEILERLRPGLLNRDVQRVGRLDAGATTDLRASVLIYVNGLRYGEKSVLRNIESSDVIKIQYYPPDESILKFGSMARGGVFDIIRR